MVILLYGSRNPLLAIISFVIVSIFFCTNNTKRVNRRFSRALFLFLILICLINFENIIKLFASILESFGLSSRTLYYFLNADTMDFSSGRIDIHNKLWGLVFDNFLMGLGVAGDEATINELAHSLYLSIFITYGLLIGVIVIIYLFTLAINSLTKSVNLDRRFILMYLCIVFPRSFTGGDIWANENLWFFMGLAIATLYNRKKIYKYNSYVCEKVYQ